MMPMTKQRLDIPLKLKSVSDSGEFEGYGSVFGVKDSYDDVVVPGAFSKSLQSWREKNALLTSLTRASSFDGNVTGLTSQRSISLRRNTPFSRSYSQSLSM